MISQEMVLGFFYWRNKMADEKETVEQTPREPFAIMDETEAEGYDLSDLSEEIENEADEQDTGEGTGLKYFREEEEGEGSKDEEAPSENKEPDSKDSKNKETDSEDPKNEESEETPDEKKDEQTSSKAPSWLTDKLKELNPELDLDNEEAVQQSINELTEYKSQADQLRQDLEAEKTANQGFYDLLMDNEDLQSVSKFMYQNKVSLPTALSALDIHPTVDLEKLKKKDPDAYLELVESKRKRQAELDEANRSSEERKKIIEDNSAKSEENATEFREAYKLDSKGFDELTSQINPELDALANGLVTKKFLKIMYEGLRVIDGEYDSKIEEARKKGLTEGKNMSVDELTKRKQGDGLPVIRSSSSEVAEERNRDVWADALHEETRISQIEKQS